jgi:two-component system phosphate regulon sensor histidine kinase PhoR
VSRRTIYILILVAVVSLSGIVITQIYWVQRAYSLQERQFNDRVVIAMSSVVDRILEANEDSSLVEPVNQLSTNFFVANINDTLHPYFLETLLREEFEALNLKEEFEYGIYDCFSDSIVYGGRVDFEKEISLEDAAKIGMQKRFAKDGHYFGIYFPAKTALVIGQMDFWVFSSFMILAVVLFFSYAIAIILKQKKLSEIKTDFINNMTHELKTPISTIGISSSMLMRDDVKNDPERQKQYAKIIYSENERLKAQVERVLQIATLSPDKLELKNETIDIHTIIYGALETLEIRMIETGGAILKNCSAQNSLIKGDKVHLTNLVYNLIDNALKYTDKEPRIEVQTSNIGRQILIEIIDNGIGIEQKHQRLIFDKFFRVPTGNVHNVKGFGLGLFYVKTVIQAHQGTVTVSSSHGKGSNFSVKLNNTN